MLTSGSISWIHFPIRDDAEIENQNTSSTKYLLISYTGIHTHDTYKKK